MTENPQLPCSRCGVFIASPADLKLLDGRAFCATCAARPDVNYLETFRLKYWGKRDGWAWFIGVGALVSLVNLTQALSAGNYAGAIGNIISCAISVGFFLGQRWARYALLASALISGSVATAFSNAERRPFVLGVAVITTLVSIAVFNDTRNQLFFKVEVSRAKLQKAWDVYSNNVAARVGVMLAFFALLIPPLAPVALLVSIIGLRNVDEKATPPIGRRGQAIIGVVVSSLLTLGWGVLLIDSLGAFSDGG